MKENKKVLHLKKNINLNYVYLFRPPYLKIGQKFYTLEITEASLYYL